MYFSDEIKILVIYFFASFILSVILVILSLIVSVKNTNKEKISAYECGFAPFSQTKEKTLDIHFYVVAILFLIFDLEIAFLFPWAANFYQLGMVGYQHAMFFLIILTLGFIYEWQRGALDWSKSNYF